tara:strand:+ start:16595 stop:16903 length:309 start_codon:yes stop_codon:yes gene_type:complete
MKLTNDEGVIDLAIAVLTCAVTNYRYALKKAYKEVLRKDGIRITPAALKKEVENFFTDTGGAKVYMQLAGLDWNPKTIFRMLNKRIAEEERERELEAQRGAV